MGHDVEYGIIERQRIRKAFGCRVRAGDICNRISTFHGPSMDVPRAEFTEPNEAASLSPAVSAASIACAFMQTGYASSRIDVDKYAL